MSDVRPDEGRPVLLLASTDAYVAHVLRLAFSDATVLQGGNDDISYQLAQSPDVVIAEVSSPSIDQLLELRDGPPVVGLMDRARNSTTDLSPGLSAVVMRPIVPAELRRVVRKALGMGEVTQGDVARRAHHWLGSLMAVSVGIAAAVNVATRSYGLLDGIVLGVAAVYAIWGMYRRRTTPAQAWLGAAVAAAGLALGGIETGYVAFALLVSLEAALVLGLIGTMAGALISAGWYAGLALGSVAIPLGPARLVAWLSLFPLTSLAGAYVRRLRTTESGERLAVLERTNRVLSRLSADAGAFPGAFEARHVLDAAVDRLGREPAIASAVVLRHELGLLTEVAVVGCPPGSKAFFTAGDAQARRLLDRDAGPVDRDDLPRSIGERMAADGPVLAHPLRVGGSVRGVIIASVHRAGERAAAAILDDVARELAIGLDNSRLFDQLRELSADEERLRLATELHEGVAQQLAHLRFELERLAGHGARDAATLRREAGRLAVVVSEALADVRGVFYGLNGSSTGAGIGTTIASYVREVRALGSTNVEFRTRGYVSVSPQVEVELFRFVRDVVEGMIEAGSERVNVVLDGGVGAVRLTVEGDCDEMAPSDLARTAGAIGAEVHVGKSAVGTLVRLELEDDPMEVFITARKEAS